MNDLIERLEEVADYDWNHERADMIREAIAEIKRLREENDRLRQSKTPIVIATDTINVSGDFQM